MPLTSRLMLRLCAIVPAVFAAFAQAPTGTITGTVTDESGAVIPAAKITIKNKATDMERATLANTDGFFSAPALPSGEYEVRCEHPGFAIVQRSATVEAGGSTTVNLP